MRIFSLWMICLITLCGCFNMMGERVNGSGNIVKETRDAGDFNGVQLMGSMDVIIKKSDTRSIEVEGDDNILSYVETYTDEGKLKIKYKNNVNIHTKNEVRVVVSTPVLEEASVLGSGNIAGEEIFTTDNKVKLQVTGSGNIKLALDAPEVDANITGSGDMELSGRTKDIDCSTTGSGTIKATELKAENVVAQTSGSGDIRVFGSVKIDARITGSGDISYKGGGAVSSKITGSGSVNPAD